jgi:hypothetical protein
MMFLRGTMASTTRLTPESLTQQFAVYEEKYGITSTEFLEKYHAGTMGDDRGIMRWAWLCSVAVKLGILAAHESKTSMTA